MSNMKMLRFTEADAKRIAARRAEREQAKPRPGRPPRVPTLTELAPPEHQPYYAMLCALLRPHQIPPPTPEFRFDPERLWRLDFAWPRAKIALEIDGGLFLNGGHNRGAALLRQYEKQNAATLAGWKIFRFAPNQLAQAADMIREAFNR